METVMQAQMPRPVQRSILKYVVGGLVIVAALAGFALSSFQSNMVFYYTVPEFMAQRAQLAGQVIRINGPLDQASVHYDQKTLTLQFDLKDGSTVVPVVYHGVVPDTMTTGESVVAEGQVDGHGIFQANSILVKCPSKYEKQE